MKKLSLEEAIIVVKAAISDVAPEVTDELDGLDPNADLFDSVGLDSMDHLNVMVGLNERTGIEIAERDYSRLRAIQSLAEHLSA